MEIYFSFEHKNSQNIMKKDEKNQKTAQFLLFSLENVEIPKLTERQMSGKDWFNWGSDNKLPYYLYGLYEKSSLM